MISVDPSLILHVGTVQQWIPIGAKSVRLTCDEQYCLATTVRVVQSAFSRLFRICTRLALPFYFA